MEMESDCRRGKSRNQETEEIQEGGLRRGGERDTVAERSRRKC